MNRRDRIRGAALLCCHCARNVAYYRAGWAEENFMSDEDFWINANGNFLDIAVLEWCKLFSDRSGKHYWKKVVPDRETSLPTLQNGIGVSEEEFESGRLEIKTYRDKFVAHLDEGRTMQIPRLELVVDSVAYLYDVIKAHNEEFLEDAPSNLAEFFNERLQHAQGQYPIAT